MEFPRFRVVPGAGQGFALPGRDFFAAGLSQRQCTFFAGP